MNIFQHLNLQEQDLYNYATKANFINATGADALHFPKKTDLANLKSDVDELDIDKVKNLSSHLGNLKSKVDRLDVDKIDVDLSKLIYNAKSKNIKGKIPDVTN